MAALPPLAFPLAPGFFPQVVLTVEELMHYRRLSKERVTQLARVVDDADCVYRWAPARAPRSGRPCQKAAFLDVRAASKAAQASTLLKSSVHLVDVGVEEILSAVAKPRTRDARRAMAFLHADAFLDTQTLLTFPTSSNRRKKKPPYAYRAMKWCALRSSKTPGKKTTTTTQDALDFCYMEYAGTCKSSSSSTVVGFCIQESVARDREVPSLDNVYGVRRGTFLRTGIVITRTHQSNILKVTSLCQLVHPSSALDRIQNNAAVAVHPDEPLYLELVAAVHRLKGLLERQRMGKLQYLDEWDWVPSADRKACAVCLRGFYFHRKHHCHTCGEVVCANCAPLRELEEPLLGRDATGGAGTAVTHKLRVCSLCMAQAGSASGSGHRSEDDDMSADDEATTTTSNGGTDTYVRGLRYPASYYTRRPHPPQPQPQPRPHPQRTSGGRMSASGSSAADQHGGRRSASDRSSNVSDRSDALARKKEALDKLVDHIRQIRDTIDEAISEVDEERASLAYGGGGRRRGYADEDDADADEDEDADGHPHSEDEKYEDIYDRILQIRETLDMSGEFDAVLAAVGGRESLADEDGSDRYPSSAADSSLAGQDEFDLTMSSHESISMLSGGSFLSSSVSSASTSSSAVDDRHEDDHGRGSYGQDAGEPDPAAADEDGHPHVHYADEEDDADKLHKALEWARQSDPLATDADADPPTGKLLADGGRPPSASIPVLTVSKNRGIERLAMKIGRLQQRLEAAAARTADDDVTGVPRTDGGDAATSTTSVADPTAGVPADLVANLRGVMNSSELTRPPTRRPAPSPPSSVGRRAPPPPVPSSTPESVRPASDPTVTLTPPTPAVEPRAGTTIYVFDEAKVNKLQPRWVPHRRSSLTQAPRAVPEDGGADERAEAEDAFAGELAPPLGAKADADGGARDESEELRELMEGLASERPARSRCSSGQSTGAPPTEKFDF